MTAGTDSTQFRYMRTIDTSLHSLLILVDIVTRPRRKDTQLAWMGIHYTYRYYNIVEEFDNKALCVDDGCLWDKTTRDNFFRACKYLDKCGRNGVILNPKKFSFSRDTVDFCGYEVGPDYVKPSKKFFTAI